jgi:hypothetical protein
MMGHSLATLDIDYMNGEIVSWIIDLQGAPYDLNNCAELFAAGTEIIRVERDYDSKSIPRYYLHSSNFEGLSDTQIHGVATELIDKLNAALKSRTGGGPVIMGLPIAIHADRSRNPMKVVSRRIPVAVEWLAPLSALVSTASIIVSSLIIPERKTAEGILVRSTSAIWHEIVQKLGSDWSLAFQLTPDQWEELVAGGFHEAGYDKVTKTPRSGDHGRDIIAIKHGFGCVKILGSVKGTSPIASLSTMQ